jgi:hypothetical protein
MTIGTRGCGRLRFGSMMGTQLAKLTCGRQGQFPEEWSKKEHRQKLRLRFGTMADEFVPDRHGRAWLGRRLTSTAFPGFTFDEAKEQRLGSLPPSGTISFDPIRQCGLSRPYARACPAHGYPAYGLAASREPSCWWSGSLRPSAISIQRRRAVTACEHSPKWSWLPASAQRATQLLS